MAVSATSKGLIASHYPVLVEEDRDKLSIVGHFGRPDDVHVTAHLDGRPEVLTDDETYEMLTRLTDHFGQHHAGGRAGPAR